MKNSNLFKVAKIINNNQQVTPVKQKENIHKQKENVINKNIKTTGSIKHFQNSTLIGKDQYKINKTQHSVLQPTKYFNSHTNKKQKFECNDKKSINNHRRSEHYSSLTQVQPSLNHSVLSDKLITYKKQTFQNNKQIKRLNKPRSSVENVPENNILQRKIAKLISPSISYRQKEQDLNIKKKSSVRIQRLPQSNFQQFQSSDIIVKSKKVYNRVLQKGEPCIQKQQQVKLSKYQWSHLIHEFYCFDSAKKASNKKQLSQFCIHFRSFDQLKLQKIQSNVQVIYGQCLSSSQELISLIQNKVKDYLKKQTNSSNSFQQAGKYKLSFQQILNILFSTNLQTKQSESANQHSNISRQNKKYNNPHKGKNILQKQQQDDQIVQTARFQENNNTFNQLFFKNQDGKNCKEPYNSVQKSVYESVNQIICKKLNKNKQKMISTPSVFTPSPKLNTKQSQKSQNSQRQIQSFFKDCNNNISDNKLQLDISQNQNYAAQQYPIQSLQLNCSKQFIESIIFSNFYRSHMNISFSEQPIDTLSFNQKSILNFEQVIFQIEEMTTQLKKYYAQNQNFSKSKKLNLQDISEQQMFLTQVINYKIFKQNNLQSKIGKQSEQNYFYACKLNQLIFTTHKSRQAVNKFLQNSLLNQYFINMQGIKITKSPFLGNRCNQMLKGCCLIKILNLSYNKITQIQNLTSILHKNRQTLQFINLSGNKIQDVSVIFKTQKLTELKQIHLKQNLIKKIYKKKKKCQFPQPISFSNLQILDLRDNQIDLEQQQSIFAIVEISHLKILALNGNPIMNHSEFDDIKLKLSQHSIYEYESLQMMSQFIKYKQISFQESNQFCLSQIMDQQVQEQRNTTQFEQQISQASKIQKEDKRIKSEIVLLVKQIVQEYQVLVSQIQVIQKQQKHLSRQFLLEIENEDQSNKQQTKNRQDRLWFNVRRQHSLLKLQKQSQQSNIILKFRQQLKIQNQAILIKAAKDKNKPAGKYKNNLVQITNKNLSFNLILYYNQHFQKSLSWLLIYLFSPKCIIITQQMRSKFSFQEFDFVKQLPVFQPRNSWPIVQSQQILLIAVANLILLTVQLTISKLLFLFTFTTIAIKIYKNFVLQKHVDRIQIKQIDVSPKSSLFVHFLSMFLYHLMESKSILKNILMFILLTGIYLIFHFIRLYAVVLIIIDLCFLGNIYLKYNNKNRRKQLQIKRTDSLLYNQSSQIKKKSISNIFQKDTSQIIQEEQIEEDLRKSQLSLPKKQIPTSRLIV